MGPKSFHFRWENHPHPYVFFNADGQTISFFGLHIDRNLNLVAEKTNERLEKRVMSPALYQGLVANKVKLGRNFDQMSRQDKLNDLCTVFGVDTTEDPDQTYELTYDNVMKMLAIHMRFRCNIPVVIMGETGKCKFPERFTKITDDVLKTTLQLSVLEVVLREKKDLR